MILEKNWESSLALSDIYMNPDEFGIEQDYVKALAYAYIIRDLNKDLVNDPAIEMIDNIEDDAIELLPRSLTPEQMQQAKALYLELMVEMNREHLNK